MKVSDEINSKNKSGVEIKNYQRGIVIDLGYRIGNTPTINKNAIVTITDKKNKTCTMKNSEFNKIENQEAELIYKTNEALHQFLAHKCPLLDISDLLESTSKSLKSINKASMIGSAPANENSLNVEGTKRSSKIQEPQIDNKDESVSAKEK